jgi:transcriptional regulator with XRE-family HTH domain
MVMDITNIGVKIKQLRLQRGWTQKQLGELLGYSESFLSYVENSARTFDIQDLPKLAEIFKIPYTHFLDETHFANFRADVTSQSKQENYDKMMNDFIKFAKDKLNK